MTNCLARLLAISLAFGGLLPAGQVMAQMQCSHVYHGASWMTSALVQARFQKLSTQEIYSFAKIPILPNELHAFQAGDGQNNVGTYWAHFKGQKVFIKEVAIPNPLIVREMAWMQIMAELGLGPQLIGFMRLPSGRTGIVSEWVSGQFVRNLNLLAKPSKAVQFQLTQIEQLFKKLQIKPIDFQFFIDQQSRIRIVDVGFYTFSNDGQEIDAAMSFY